MAADPLAQIRIASPCTADWSAMSPADDADRVRFCAACRKNVYNLSGMPREEAEALIRAREGEVCVRLYRRRDGTVMTDDCPVGLRRARRWLVGQLAGVTGAFGLLAMMAVLAPHARADRLRESELFQRVRHSRLATVEPFQTWFDRIDPPSPIIMGAMPAPVSQPPLPGG